MKVTVEFDITPLEARKLMGLPDVEAMQEKIIGQVYETMSESIANITDPVELFQRFVPMGAQGVEQFQKLMGGLAAKAMGGGERGGDKGANK
jgi:hypothetical protein